ncbi:prepilin peptidase [Candidatus Parcubacteria bacterium]|nr:prepilin peptidase [Candidatus Parcubacteria bacterium]
MLTLALVTVLGLLVGSFINAAVWRLHQQSAGRSTGSGPTGQTSNVKGQSDVSITHGRSMCPRCRHRLAATDLIPLLSWVWLRGRCRYCQAAIPAQYPLVELLTAGLFAWSYSSLLTTHYSPLGVVDFAFWLYFLTVLIVLALYDARWMLLPDVVLLPAIVVALLQLPVSLVLGQPFGGVWSALLAAALAGGGFYAIAWVTRGKGMGGGDIKLAFLMGLLLGLGKTGVALFVAFMSAALVGVALVAVARLMRHRRPKYIAFGPFLIAGTVIAKLHGAAIIEWYLRGLY